MPANAGVPGTRWENSDPPMRNRQLHTLHTSHAPLTSSTLCISIYLCATATRAATGGIWLHSDPCLHIADHPGNSLAHPHAHTDTHVIPLCTPAAPPSPAPDTGTNMSKPRDARPPDHKAHPGDITIHFLYGGQSAGCSGPAQAEISPKKLIGRRSAVRANLYGLTSSPLRRPVPARTLQHSIEYMH